jgi:hypothetical protein
LLNRGLYGGLIVVGLAVIMNGFVGKSLLNDVEMPLSQEELDNPQAPTRWARILYIVFGLLIVAFGIFRFASR